MHERHGSNLCSTWRFTLTRTWAPASPGIPESNSLSHQEAGMPVISLQLVASTQQWTVTASSQFLSVWARTSASDTGKSTQRPDTQASSASTQQTQADLKHASCFSRAVWYLHGGLTHSDFGSSELTAAWRACESEGGQGRGGRGGREEGRSFQEMMLLLVSD